MQAPRFSIFVCRFLARNLFFSAMVHLLTGVVFGQSTDSRILQVEQSLIPYGPVAGFEGWKLEDRMAYHHVQGASIAVIHDFKVEWAKGYGWADTARHIPMTTETMLSAGSISKWLMAVGALRLVEADKLSLDAPINSQLRSWQLAENEFTATTPVSLRMLLSHTGGTSQSAYFGFTPDKQPFPTILEIVNGEPVAESRRVGVNRLPGTGFQYSGGGSMVAQLAMMDVTGQNFETLMRELIFNPLKMKTATFSQPLTPDFAARASWGYSEAPWYKGMPYVYPQQAAAGLYCTPTDLARFLVDLQRSYRGEGKVLSPSSIQTMLQPQATVSEGYYREEIGVGPFLLQRTDNQDEKGIYLTFDGVNAGFTAFAVVNLVEGNGAVVMLNSGDDFNGLGKEIMRAVADVYDWHHFLPDPVKPVLLSDSQLDSYTGRYRMGNDEVVNLRREKNYLVENINSGKDIYCFPIASDSIIFTDFNVKAGFNRDSSGAVISLQNVYQSASMPRMRADEFTLSELLRDRKYEEAKVVIRSENMDESRITYMAFQRAKDPDAAKAILEVAIGQYPESAMVHARWGDYFLAKGDKALALNSYRLALKYNPEDEEMRKKIDALR